MIRTLAVAVVLFLSQTTPAAAYVVEVTTSVQISDVTDEPRFEQAIRSAVDGVLRDAIAFTPTLVVITYVGRAQGRVYLHLMILDKDGEETLAELLRDAADAPASSPGLSL